MTNEDWVIKELESVRAKIDALMKEECHTVYAPGSRSIVELAEHIRDYASQGAPNLDLHTAYHLGEISLLCKLAISRRS